MGGARKGIVQEALLSAAQFPKTQMLTGGCQLWESGIEE